MSAILSENGRGDNSSALDTIMLCALIYLVRIAVR